MAIEGDTDLERHRAQALYEPPAEPPAAATKARDFQRGDTVTFVNRDDQTITGVIVRINQRTATLGTGKGDSWRVPFDLLRHVLDI